MKPAVAVTPCLAIILAVHVSMLYAADQAQFGQRFSRNMVSDEKGLPETFDPGQRTADGQIDLATTRNVKWVARLGNTTYGSPAVAGGRVLIGTNNGEPRDPRLEGDRGVLMCFDEQSGEFLWQLNVPKMLKVKWSDWQECGISSTPAVDSGRAYLVSNACEVICLDLQGMANGNDGPYTGEGRHMVAPGEPPLEPGSKDADILWLYDMTEELGAEAHNASNCSILVCGDLLYVCTSNGVEWTHMKVINPDSPSLIVLDKNTGKLVARDQFGIGPDITHGQWSSPSMGEVGGHMLAFFGAGNGCLYAFEPVDPTPTADSPQLLRNAWKFHGHPLSQTQTEPPPADHQHDSTSYEVTAMPVFCENRVYVPFTQEPFHNMKKGWLVCLDSTKTGDVTRGSAMVWSYDAIGSTPATVAVADGLVYAVGYDGRLHCLDAQTGQVYWVHDGRGPACGSPLVADGKVYLGTAGQMFWVLSAGKELKVLSQIRMRDKIHTTPVAANGVLYVATNRHLYALGKQPPPTDNGSGPPADH